MWTRVFTREDCNDKLPGIFPIGLDLQFDKALRATINVFSARNGEVLFSTKLFTADDISTESSKGQPNPQELMELGVIATEVKKRFTVDDQEESKQRDAANG